MKLLKQSLDHEDIAREKSCDPFQALKHRKAVAEAITIKLAACHRSESPRRESCVDRSVLPDIVFCFGS